MPRTKALILDTNVILRFLLNDVPELYVKAEQVLQVLTTALSIWNESNLDWTDALLVAMTSHGNTKLVTFNREIAKNFPDFVFPT